MGPIIHWVLHGPTTAAEAKAVLEKLRQQAMDMPVEDVSDLTVSRNSVGFVVTVAPGCKSMAVFLCRHEQGWSSTGTCDTQGAGRPEYGDTPNFVRAYLLVWSLLDVAKGLGILAEASESGDMSFFDEGSRPLDDLLG